MTGRPRTGSLYFAKSGWRARLTVEIDGERIKQTFDLGTQSKAAARMKLKRLQKEHVPTQQEASREETFREAAERIVGDSDIASKSNRLGRLNNHVYPHIGDQLVSRVESTDIEDVLRAVAVKGLSKDLVVHVRHDIGAVMSKLWRARLIPEDVMARVETPKGKVDNRHRAVLTDQELATYLAWSHPDETFAVAVLERQTMACVSRMFGGVRIGDIRALKWEELDTEAGRFEMGWAPRKKTDTPQLLEIPKMLRPILRDWWRRHDEPSSGPVFPARKGKRAGEEKGRSNVAAALRRDLKRALGLEVPIVQEVVRSNGRPFRSVSWVEGRPMTKREVELFEETTRTKPVDFHSFRRAFKQGLAEAGTDVQTSLTLSGASDLKTHMRYLRNTSKMRTVPTEALPTLDMDHVQTKRAAEVGDPDFSSDSAGLCGAGEGIRTLDVNLGKVALYH